jgi:hypothetical protein
VRRPLWLSRSDVYAKTNGKHPWSRPWMPSWRDDSEFAGFVGSNLPPRPDRPGPVDKTAKTIN